VTNISKNNNYFKQAKKIRKMHMFAGGVKMAANLIQTLDMTI